MNNSLVKYLLLLSVLLNLTILGTAGYSHYQRNPSWSSPFGQQMPGDQFLFEKLGLEPAQVEAIKKKAIPFRAEIGRRRAELAGKRQHLVTLMRQDTPNPQAIRALIAEISAIQEEMQHRISAHMLGVKAMLDKEQQQRFLDLIENTMSKGSRTGCPSTE